MHRKKAGKFLFIPDNLVVVLFLIALLNIASTELHKPLPVKDEGESDSEEINELSRLQDPGSQDPQVGGAINEGDAGKIKPTIDNSMVPSDQNQSASDTLANISEFLKSKEGETADPVDGDFTLWTTWSSCPHACGRTALRSRERYCTNPAPANGGRNCEGPRFQLKLCKLKQCAVDGGYSEWSDWTSCSQKCGQGMKRRRRYCNNPKPANGGQKCKGAKKQVKPCYGKKCQDQDSIVDIDPQTVCGYNPCRVAKCILLPYATCVSDFKCRPVFFDSEERKVSQCTGDNLYLNVDPQAVCRFNPCKYTTCLQGAAAKCVVNTRCHPVFLDAFGKTIKCKGVFKVPARYICGYDPCNGAVCKADPTARCLVEHTCKAMFVNSYNQRKEGCKARHHIAKEEDEEEEQVNDDENNDDDDGSRISKLMSSKLGIGVRKDNNDDDEDDEDGISLTKLIGSKMRVRKKENDDDDGIRISKLINSKLSVGDKDDNDDDKVEASEQETTEESETDVRSKLPSRFKRPTRKDFEKHKKNRFKDRQSNRSKSHHKRWLGNA